MREANASGQPITVVISTRNRGPGVARTLETIFESDYPDFSVILVDQSDDDRTRLAVQRFSGRPDFSYVRSEERGLAAARNEGICRSSSKLVVMTDDDCEVFPDWLRSFARGFDVDERIGVVFGNVMAGEHDREQGFIPAYHRSEPYLARSIWEKHHVEGIGACMGVRRSVWETLHGFDVSFGAGARFQSSEDLDFAIRTLLAGSFVYSTPDACVRHYGFRTWQQGGALVTGYLYGIGAVFAKLIKTGRWSVLVLLWHLACRWALGGPVVDLGRKPPRILRLRAFARGFLAAMFAPVDRRSGHCTATKKAAPADPPPRSVTRK